MSTPRSPKLANRLLERLAANANLEDILGDLEESYHKTFLQAGKVRAWLFYWRETLSILFSYTLKKRKKDASYSHYYSAAGRDMLVNYVKVALRSMAKQKLFTGINILGLALGMSLNLLILAILSQVIQFDHFHEKKDRIFRITTTKTDAQEVTTYASTFPEILQALKENYPAVEEAVLVKPISLSVLKHANEVALRGAFTSSDYFQVFSFKLENGNAQTCLNDPNSIVLSQKSAALLFPSQDPMGKSVELADGKHYKVTGLLAKHPPQTHLSFDALVSLNPSKSQQVWSDEDRQYVYFALQPNADASEFESALAPLAKQVSAFQKETQISFGIQPLLEISPGKDLARDNVPFDWLTTILLFVLGLLILIPACFNYTNLMIARALKRAKEIGIRKVVGSFKSQIASQFIVESVVLTLMALVGSLFIYLIIREEVSGMIIGAETLDLSLDFRIVSWFVGFAVLTGIAVGVFPALYFAKISPLSSLKGETTTVKISNIRKSLIVIQFSLSLGFVIGVAVIASQYHQLLNYRLGFEKENMLVVPLQGQNPALVVAEFSSLPQVQSVALTSHVPGVEGGKPTAIFLSNDQEDSVNVYSLAVDTALISAMGLELLWGDIPDQNTDKNGGVLVNQTYMRSVREHHSEDSLRMILEGRPLLIGGVIRDFNFMPLNNYIEPLIIQFSPDKANYAILNIQSNDMIETLNQLENRWVVLDQNVSFESFFLDHKIEEAYQSTVFMIKVFSFLGVLSITISCIGILGMVVFLTENRTKELAIRKVMGANLIQLYRVIGSSFMKLLLVASIITTPLAFFFYDRIFVTMISKYSVGVGWIELVVSVAIMFVLVSLPLLWMINRIAKVNPSENLRYE